MESLGNKLRSAREEKGLTHDFVSRETNISARYLEALENENFTCFPGEPYAVGFLKNYSDFLGIDQDEIMSLYRSFKIQEQPVPVEQLLRGPSPWPKILKTLAIIILVLGLGAGGYFFIMHFPRAEQAPSPVVREPSEYVLNAGFLERRFYPGDSVLVSDGTNTYKLAFTNLGDALTITAPAGPVMLDLGQEVTIDLNNDGFMELRIIASDFVKNNAASGALMRFEQSAPPQTPVVAEISMETEIIRGGRETAAVIYASPNPMPFTLQAVFQSYCFFRYELIAERDRPGRTEQYYQRSHEINITAQNGVRLGISNAQAVRLQVIIGGRSYPFETGSAGEVVAADVRWVRDEDNRYRLVFMRLQ